MVARASRTRAAPDGRRHRDHVLRASTASRAADGVAGLNVPTVWVCVVLGLLLGVLWLVRLSHSHARVSPVATHQAEQDPFAAYRVMHSPPTPPPRDWFFKHRAAAGRYIPGAARR